MFALEETELSRAVERAKALHPTVRIIGFGKYSVTGSQAGSLYTVRCWKENGKRWVDCTCKTADGIACKHGVAAVALHIYMATVKMIMERRARRTAYRVR